ncbi:MAG: KaiC domain-containing protein [Halohasta sp.]
MSGDWFEEALEELDDEPVDRDADESVASSIEDAFDIDPADTDADPPTDSDDDSAQTDDTAASTDQPTGSPDEFDADTGGSAEAGSVDPFGFDTEDADDPDDPDSGAADPFGFGSGDGDSGPAGDGADEGGRPEPSPAQSAEEFGFSLDDAPTPGEMPVDEPTPASGEPTAGGSTASGSTPEDGSGTQPEAGGGDDPFGFGSSGGQSVGGGGGQPDEDFGFGGFGGGGGGGTGPEEFDEEEFDSDIDRIDLGIDGLDEMILGGVPERSLIGIIGGAGTGKTTFGLQFLNEALKNGERAVFITLEQTEEAVLSTAEEKGWPFRQYVDDDQLVIVVLDPVEMANSLASIRGDISRLIREFGASRLVLDSVSLLEMMYDHPAKRRSEIFDFTRSLKDAGVTTLLTSEASEDSSHASRYGAVEYLTDAVFVLRYVRTSNFEETRLAIEIQKIRDANHSRATKPYDLTDEGMSVHRQANIF